MERGPGRHGLVSHRGGGVPVEAGQTIVIPPRSHHTVSAGDEELALLAIFVPTLA